MTDLTGITMFDAIAPVAIGAILDTLIKTAFPEVQCILVEAEAPGGGGEAP